MDTSCSKPSKILPSSSGSFTKKNPRIIKNWCNCKINSLGVLLIVHLAIFFGCLGIKFSGKTENHIQTNGQKANNLRFSTPKIYVGYIRRGETKHI
jgi:hypothetical protein